MRTHSDSWCSKKIDMCRRQRRDTSRITGKMQGAFAKRFNRWESPTKPLRRAQRGDCVLLIDGPQDDDPASLEK